MSTKRIYFLQTEKSHRGRAFEADCPEHAIKKAQEYASEGLQYLCIEDEEGEVDVIKDWRDNG